MVFNGPTTHKCSIKQFNTTENVGNDVYIVDNPLIIKYWTTYAITDFIEVPRAYRTPNERDTK